MHVNNEEQKQPVPLQSSLQIEMDFQLTPEMDAAPAPLALQVRYIADIASANQTVILPHACTLRVMERDTETGLLRETAADEACGEGLLPLTRGVIYRLRWSLPDPSAVLLPVVEERYMTQVGVLRFQFCAPAAAEAGGDDQPALAQVQLVSETKKASNGKLFWSLYSPFDV